MLPGRDRQLTTAAVTVGMILSALEATAVAAAVPTAVGGMGEIGRYSWVFSAYLLTSTITIPLFGKLADLYGRKRTYVVSVVIFLVGSCLCGVAQTLPQLAAFRAIQGVGAGGMLPISSVILGDIFSLEERGRMQALFSAVWAFASLVGPLVGGFLTDTLSWRWIFFLNLPFGFVSIALLVRHFREEPPPREHGLDVWGTAALAASAALLLMGLIEGGHAWGFGDPRTIGMFVGSAIALAWFLKLQRRTPEPTLPLEIFSNRVIAVSSLGNATLGATLYALTAFVPLFGQAVLGGTATDAGKLLTPLLVGWPIASTIAGRMIGRMSYRRMAILGGLFLSVGALALASMGPNPHRLFLPTVLFAFGLGLGFLSMPYFLGVQNAVPWRLRGVARAASNSFVRSAARSASPRSAPSCRPSWRGPSQEIPTSRSTPSSAPLSPRSVSWRSPTPMTRRSRWCSSWSPPSHS